MALCRLNFDRSIKSGNVLHRVQDTVTTFHGELWLVCSNIATVWWNEENVEVKLEPRDFFFSCAVGGKKTFLIKCGMTFTWLSVKLTRVFLVKTLSNHSQFTLQVSEHSLRNFITLTVSVRCFLLLLMRITHRWAGTLDCFSLTLPQFINISDQPQPLSWHKLKI